jgi:hypothetical protein
MAKNLRAKIPDGDTMTVFDVNQTTLDRFSQEAVPAGVVVAKSPREVVENAVSPERCEMYILHLYDEPIVLSMI